MKLFSSIKESVSQIADKILKQVVEKVNRVFLRKQVPVEAIARSLLRQYLLKQPEVMAVMNGNLRYELGITDASSKMLNIIDRIVNSVKVDFTPFKAGGGSISGGIQIRSVNVDFSDIINMPDAIQETEKGQLLPWLQWLLYEGRGIIIQDYEVQFGHFGRTGGAHMILGNGWGIPNMYAGTEDDNFITRAIAEMLPQLREEINKCLT